MKVTPRARSRDDRAGDPLDGLVNLFDLGIVLSVAFLLAALSSLDLTETDQLILNSVAYSNIPLPHIAMSQALFDRQAFHVAIAIDHWKQPGLIHCSSGDRASAGFAAFLITCCGYSNAQALDFALHHLALQNQQFVDYVKAYTPPK